MKRTFVRNKVSISSVDQLNKLAKINILTPVDEVVISIPGCSIDFDKIPSSVYVMKFNYNIKNLPHEIPSDVKMVYFYEFAHLLEELPTGVEHIQIYKGFNHPVDKLGNHLKSIDFGLDFNQSVDDLPSSLEKVVFYQSFTHSINNLPSSVNFIHIYNSKYDFKSIKSFPKSIILLELELDPDSNHDQDYCFNSIFDLACKNYTIRIEENYNINKGMCLKNIYFF